jgi:CSLREA domain-containing protein
MFNAPSGKGGFTHSNADKVTGKRSSSGKKRTGTSARRGSMDRIRPARQSGLATVLLLLLASPVFALNVYVDRLDDEYDGCSLDSCSLREAIQFVNNNSEYDTIYLPAGTIELSRVGAGEDDNTSGDLDIRRSVTIVGKGPGVSIVDANYLDRVFHIMDPGVAVLFKRITITRGGNPAMGDGGGGVFVSQGTAAFLHCDIVGNVSEVGGGSSGCGGGIQASHGATLWIEESSVRWNSADSLGGGIFFNANQNFILRSTVSQNFAGLGGAAVWGGSGYITDSTISGNFGPTSEGGAIHVFGQLTIEFCTLTDNTDPTITLCANLSGLRWGIQSPWAAI